MDAANLTKKYTLWNNVLDLRSRGLNITRTAQRLGISRDTVRHLQHLSSEELFQECRNIRLHKLRKYVTDLYTGEKVERGVYKSSTFARDLNVSVGFGFPFYLGRKTNRKSSHRERTRQLMEQKRKTYGLFPGNK